jgi:hypothetical protein
MTKAQAPMTNQTATDNAQDKGSGTMYQRACLSWSLQFVV